ncbi:MAG TPA: NAD(P)H-binding protein, partial [Candidatus Thermoplasmatota archaeon]|nr:NAD(P)H-binding protein [Candidatus Thermoplasmatota archaeon]
MRVLLFGASGMVGQGVLRECLAADDVEEVVCVGRRPLGQSHPKLAELVQDDVADLSAIAKALPKFDACFFPLGVSSAGMEEDEYRKVTHDLTLSVARRLHAANPEMTFVYVSGAGTDSTEKGRSMWARVKGKTENDLLALFPDAYMFRPGVIRPLDGIRSRTPLYNRLYVVLRPIVYVAGKIAPGSMLTTRSVGQAMLSVARHGFAKRVLEPKDINEAA